MATTLSQLTYLTAVELGAVREGLVTTGGTDTFTDSLRLEGTDYWNKGTCWILDTTDDLAPVGEYGGVVDFGSGVFSFTATPATFSAAITVGDTYAVGRRRYPLDLLKQQVNKSYRLLGDVIAEDTSLATTASTTEYDIPIEAQHDLREVWIKTNTYSANDPGWVKITPRLWRQEGTYLYLPQLGIGKTIKLIYSAVPSLLVDFDDAIHEAIHPSRVIYKAAAGCVLWRARRMSGNQRAAELDEARRLLEEDQRAAYDHPITIPPRPAKGLAIALSSDVEEDEFTAPWP